MGKNKEDFNDIREFQHLKEKGEIISNAEYTESILKKTKTPDTLTVVKATGLEDIANNCNVDVKQAEDITLGLKPFIEERALLIQEFEEVSKLEVTEENIKIFKTLRLKFQKNRTQGTNSWHKISKEIPLRMGQLIDAVKRNENKINETHESFLEKAEKTFENIEKERIEKLKEDRKMELELFGLDEYPSDLGNMSESVWLNYLTGVRVVYDQQIAAEKQAEAQRIEAEKAERERIEKIEAENKRLEKEAKEKERLAKIEQDKRDKEEAENEKARRVQANMIAKIEADKQAVLNAKIQKERLAKEKLEIEIEKKKQAELDEALAKEAKEKALLLAPDKDKLIKLANDLSSFPMPDLSSEEANNILTEVKKMIIEINLHIKTKSELL